MPRNCYWKTPVKSSTPAKKLEQLAKKKPPSAPKPKKNKEVIVSSVQGVRLFVKLS
ncbi:hypothetical protein [Oryza sativa Japonica Group]|uniref:Uncharacterized protein n=1 Tax=Oryza sativa subsp. japonica TaxID=39947 RepID=Q5JK94_ORYSJ|nr:hypothetical protein [Oryza sativa Japonica Group]BAD88113.1 hypothetical protein [Oryza sativa Japonica Group]